ncbi:MAG TPA: hypothetical protein DEG13_09065 [Candidatus Microthrix parvicella]|nr:hypothetical protein [Candidatus Microthrix parvicella]
MGFTRPETRGSHTSSRSEEFDCDRSIESSIIGLMAHLHLDGKSSPHYPTGRVLIENVLMLAVEMGAEPVDRARWDECCERNRFNFALGATWGLPVSRA